jgi:type IV pilus assembly protein PilB
MLPAKVLEKFLVDTKLVTEEDLAKYKSEANSKKVDLEDLLIEHSVVTDDQLLNFKSQILNLESVDLRKMEISPEALNLIPEPIARRHLLIALNLIPEPIARRHLLIAFATDKQSLSLAMYDPEDLQTKEFIKKKTGLLIRTFVTSRKSVEFGLSPTLSAKEPQAEIPQVLKTKLILLKL